MKFYATLKEGKFKFESEDFMKQRISELKDGEYTWEVTKYFNQRSNQENKYYWAVVVELVYEGLRDLGYGEIKTRDDAHNAIKSLFFSKVIKPVPKKRKVGRPRKHEGEIVVAGSTAKVTTKDFEEKMEEIRRWSAEYLGVSIPEPNEKIFF